MKAVPNEWGAAGKSAKSMRRWLKLGQARVIRYIYKDAAYAHNATLRLVTTLLLSCMHEGSWKASAT